MIEFRDIWKSFGGDPVLRGIDMHVERGETMVIVGQSGQGKSVTLKIIAGLMAADRGEYVLDGETIDCRTREHREHIRERVNMVFQFGALFDSLNIYDNVGFTLLEKNLMPRAEITKRVTECLEMVQLPGIEHLKPADLSGGMKKRVGLARALITKPSIMLYDEPTSGLDPVTSDLINDLILETQERLGMTSVVVTHDIRSAEKIGDRITMLCEGELIATGTAEDLRNSDDPRVEQFMAGRAKGPLTKEVTTR